MVLLLVSFGFAGLGLWSHRVLSDGDVYAAAVAPLCGHRWTTRFVTITVRRRLRRSVGARMTARLNPLVERCVAASGSWPVARGWVVANRLAHRHRRRFALKSVPAWAVAPAMVAMATAGRLLLLADRGKRFVLQ